MIKNNAVSQIVITGGKGGVGKSTVAILLANQLSTYQKVILVDVDVECPNDYLLLDQTLAKTPNKKIYAKFPVLDKDKCLRCGLCAQKCRFNAIFAPKDKYPIFLHQLCSNCGLCWNLCPAKAIKIKSKITGKIYQNQINTNLYLVTGQTVGIVDETGPLVRQTKKYALDLATKLNVKTVLIDTAPGTHCNVINALLDADHSFAVTEPTPLGAHDLKLILKLNQELKIPTQIILNQSDLGNQKLIQTVAHHFKTDIIHQIPYSKEIVTAYSRGKLNHLTLNGYV